MKMSNIKPLGNPERIGGNLRRLVLENDVLENSGILLERKVWIEPKEQFGRLYSRQAYLEKKRGSAPKGANRK